MAQVRVEDEPSSSKRRFRTEDAANKDRPLLRSGRKAPIFVYRALQASSSAWIVLVMLATPPFLVVFPNAERLLLAASQGLPADEVNALRGLIERNLPPVTSVQSLALLFGISPSLIGAMSRNAIKYYRTFTIQSGRRNRQIHTPKVALKLIQNWFGHHLSYAVQLHDHVHGFVPKRSTVTAAQQHCPARWVFSVDIRDFFGSVSAERVFTCLIRLGYTRAAAHLMSDLSTIPLEGQRRGLPQGAPTSPVIANVAFRDTDHKLAQFAAERGLKISRYADDISLSGQGQPGPGLSQEIEQLITSAGWVIASNKTRLIELPQRCPQVLGLLIDQPTPRLPKHYRNRLRMMRYALKTKALTDAERAILAGHIAYAESIR